ncbi:hypothetical protein [Methylophaga sp.]|uniref:hypothetical protein n=1 Tax=Methylophaga sp. TaxID=2024840 RepID=UPI002724AA6F|nr:hypothetical protein [Methylophaga sp.]MDO8827974.1 hypothetical protein [Methylophaga sp.]
MLRTNPILRNLSIVAVSSVLAGFYVMSGHATRDYPDIENLKMQIVSVNTEIDVVSQKPDLPLLPDTWQSISVIASSHGVKVTPLKDGKAAGITELEIPGGTPWFGVLQGNSRSVAMAAMEIQKVVPILFGAAALDNAVIGLGFAALGSEN